MQLQGKKASVTGQVLSPKGKEQRTSLTALLKKVWKGTPEKKELEYISSPRMRQRVKAGRRLSVHIHGNYGVYRTSLKGDRGEKLTYSCTCPSPYYPCKHAAALAHTYLKEPETFFDIDTLRPRLEQMDKEQLTSLLLTCLTEYPRLLTVLGFVAQEEEEEEEEDDNEEEWEDDEEEWEEEDDDEWEDEE